MKKRLFHIALFLLLLKTTDWLLGAGLDYCHEHNHYGENGGNLNAYLAQKSCDTLFVGASRFQNGVDPKAFGAEAWNLSHQQMHVLFQAGIIDLLAQKGKLPKSTLIWHVEVEDFCPDNDQRNLSDIHFLRYYYHQSDFIRTWINRADRYAPLKFAFSSYRHNKQMGTVVSNYLLRRNEQVGQRGFFGLPALHTLENPEITDIRLHREWPLTQSVLAESCVEHVKKICDKHRLQLIIVTAPLYETGFGYRFYSQSLKHFLNLERIAWLNYNDPPYQRHYPYHLWYDAKHLNADGAQLFTRQLKSDLKHLKPVP